jgi:uncharacterized protein
MAFENIIVGRITEKQYLDKLLKSNEAAFLAVYGRRRVGKTFLIRQYLKNVICFDMAGQKNASLSKQLENFVAEYNEKNKKDKIDKPLKSWSEAFRLLADYLKKLPPTKKHVVFIDEMPWLDSSRSGFKSALDYFWNRHASGMNHIVLIGCGSSTSWITKNLIKATGGLYKRVTHRMKLLPFTLQETEYYFKRRKLHFNKKAILDIYMIIGGIPHYLKEITTVDSTAKIIESLCFNKKALLKDEYNILFESLFENATFHKDVIETLSKHHYGMTQKMILEKLNIAQSTLSRTLTELEESDFVSKCTTFNKNRKDVVYRVIDPFSLFYNKFMKTFESAGKSKWQNFATTQRYKIWCGYAYENICYSHIDGILNKLGISGIVTSAHAWTYNRDKKTEGAQIDLIIDRADNCINICEVKYSSNNFILSKEQLEKIQKRKSIFIATEKTKKQVFSTLITVDKPIENANYYQEIHSSVTLEDLFLVGELD